MAKRNTEKLNNEDAYIKLFESFGYTVFEDGRYARGEVWYEIYDDGLIAQLDKGVPIEDFLEDCESYIQDKTEGTSKSDYILSSCYDLDNIKYRQFLQNMIDYKNKELHE
jgi:hypothetical protein